MAPAYWETCMPVKKQQLELDMEKWTGSKLGKEYVKAVYCHPAYIASIQSTSWVPWTARKSNQSILKEISPEYSLQGLMLKLKLQYFGHLIWRTDSFKRLWCWERLKVGGEGDNRGWNGWMASLTWWTWVWVSSGIGDGQGSLVCCSPPDSKELDTTERLNWGN